MPNERSNVRFPLWRKKMDGAMFDHQCTVLPNWVRDNVFDLKERFPHASKDHPESAASIVIHRGKGKRTVHSGYVTTSERGDLPDVMRLYFGNDVLAWLEEAFNKTFLRNEERKARGLNGPTIERIMPFWEFIDIEWDAESSAFHFRDWYTQGDFTENIPGEPLEDETGNTKLTTMAECIELAIRCMELRLDGRSKRFKWYNDPKGRRIHLKYSKYYERHMNYWFGVTPESIEKSKALGISHFGFVLADRGCVILPIESLRMYVMDAKTSDHEDGTVRHHHLFISSEDPPEVFNYDSRRRYDSEFVSFDGCEGPASPSDKSRKPPPPKLPDRFAQALEDILG